MADGISVTEHPDPGEVVWCDDAGVTCRRWNWRQARRTQLTDGALDTSRICGSSIVPPQAADDRARAAICQGASYLRARVHPQPGEDLAEMELNGLNADVKIRGDLPIGLSRSCCLGNGKLAAGQEQLDRACDGLRVSTEFLVAAQEEGLSIQACEQGTRGTEFTCG